MQCPHCLFRFLKKDNPRIANKIPGRKGQACLSVAWFLLWAMSFCVTDNVSVERLNQRLAVVVREVSFSRLYQAMVLWIVGSSRTSSESARGLWLYNFSLNRVLKSCISLLFSAQNRTLYLSQDPGAIFSYPHCCKITERFSFGF